MKYIEINDAPLFKNVDVTEKDGMLTIKVNNITLDEVSSSLTTSVKDSLWRIMLFSDDVLESKFYGYSKLCSVDQNGDSVVIVLNKMSTEEMIGFVLETVYEFKSGSKNREISYSDFTQNIDSTILDIIKSDIAR